MYLCISLLLIISVINNSNTNLDILGAPIGDYLHFIAGSCAESRKLLSGLVDVAAVDLQV